MGYVKGIGQMLGGPDFMVGMCQRGLEAIPLRKWPLDMHMRFCS